MQHIKELAKERKRKRNLKDSDSDRNIIQEPEEPGWDSSEVEEDVTAIGLLQRSAGSVSNESDLEESEDDELEDVLVSEGEELEEVDESAFGRLMASAESSQGMCGFLSACCQCTSGWKHEPPSCGKQGVLR